MASILAITYTVVLPQESSSVTLRLDDYSNYVSRKAISTSDANNREAHKNPNFDNNGDFAVDILSVASLERYNNLVQQQKTFGSHPSVRNFFNATEVDDYDPLCHKELTVEQVMKVSRFCRRRPANISRTMKYLRGMFARKQWLERKPNMVGWLCAIQRPYAGLKKVYSYYNRQNESLPNYFIILDDDSYYNMESFTMNNKGMNSTLLSVTAGCLVRQPGKLLFPVPHEVHYIYLIFNILLMCFTVHQINFTFPFGGFGAVFSGASLNYLFQPVRCHNNESISHENSDAICRQLSQDIAGELQYFQDGMSLLDLIYMYVNTERYRDVDQWKSGFCMHSDWVMGYFINYYNVSAHVSDEWYKDIPHARIEAYKDSVLYRRPTGFCKFEKDCPKGAEICHKPPEGWIENEMKLWINTSM